VKRMLFLRAEIIPLYMGAHFTHYKIIIAKNDGDAQALLKQISFAGALGNRNQQIKVGAHRPPWNLLPRLRVSEIMRGISS